MPRRTADVNWYGDDVRLAFNDAAEEVLRRAAFQIVAQAKVNISVNGQVDTGFMRASGYVIVKDEGDTFSAAQSDATSRNPDAVMAPRARLRDGDVAAVCFGAEYSIYQERRRSFLYRALEQTSDEIGGLIEEVSRERGLH